MSISGEQGMDEAASYKPSGRVRTQEIYDKEGNRLGGIIIDYDRDPDHWEAFTITKTGQLGKRQKFKDTGEAIRWVRANSFMSSQSPVKEEGVMEGSEEKPPRMTHTCEKCGKKWQLQHHCKGAPNKKQGVAEGSDEYGFHTSVSKGKFLPSKYGQDENNLYLHDLMNVSGDGSGPQLVTINDKRIATELAAMYGGYVEKTGMGTYRVYQPRGARQTTKKPEQQGVAEDITSTRREVNLKKKIDKGVATPEQKKEYQELKAKNMGRPAPKQGVAEGQLDELKKSTVKSYADKKQAELDDVPPMPFKKPTRSKAEIEKDAKGMMGALSRLSGKKPTSEGVTEGKPNQLPTQGADYSKYDTDHLRTLLKPGILHRNEARFKALIRKELKKREQQGVAEGLEKKDMTGKTCEKCKKDTYQERSLRDDWEGTLRCSCGHVVDRWRKYKKKDDEQGVAEGWDVRKDDIRQKIYKYEDLALAANKAGDDEKCKMYQKKIQSLKQKMAKGVTEGSDKLQGTPVVSLKDFDDTDTKKDKYGRAVPKKLKKDDPRVKFHKDSKQGVAEGFKNTYEVGDRVDGPLGTGTIVAVSKNVNIDGRVKVKLDDPSKAGEDGKYKDSFVLTTTQLKHISEQGVAEGMDPEKRTRLDDLIDQFSDATDPSDYGNDNDPEDVIAMIRAEFGDKIADQVASGAEKMHFGHHPHQRSDPLAWKTYRGKNRVTKGGKLFKQDSDYLKNTIKSRYKLSGKSATEGVAEADMPTDQGDVGAGLGAGRSQTTLEDTNSSIFKGTQLAEASRK